MFPYKFDYKTVLWKKEYDHTQFEDIKDFRDSDENNPFAKMQNLNERHQQSRYLSILGERIGKRILEERFNIFDGLKILSSNMIRIQSKKILSLCSFYYLSQLSFITIRKYQEVKKENIHNVMNNFTALPTYLRVLCSNCREPLIFHEEGSKWFCNRCSEYIETKEISINQIAKINSTSENSTLLVNQGFLKPNQKFERELNIVYEIDETIYEDIVKRLELGWRTFVDIESVIQDTKYFEEDMLKMYYALDFILSQITRIGGLSEILPEEKLEQLIHRRTTAFEWCLDYLAIPKEDTGFNINLSYPIFIIDAKSYKIKKCQDHHKRHNINLNRNQREYIGDILIQQDPIGVLLITIGLCNCGKIIVKIIDPEIRKNQESLKFFEKKKKLEYECLQLAQNYIFKSQKIFEKKFGINVSTTATYCENMLLAIQDLLEEKISLNDFIEKSELNYKRYLLHQESNYEP